MPPEFGPVEIARRGGEGLERRGVSGADLHDRQAPDAGPWLGAPGKRRRDDGTDSGGVAHPEPLPLAAGTPDGLGGGAAHGRGNLAHSQAR